MRDYKDLTDSTETIGALDPHGMSLEFSRKNLKVAEIMTETIISVDLNVTVGGAIKEMDRCCISCIVVTHLGRVQGILTERDVLRGVATHYKEFLNASITSEMSQPVIGVDPETTVLTASKLMSSKSIKRLLVVEDHQPLGVVTQTDVTNALIRMAPFKDIASLMARTVVTVDASATIEEAALLMAADNISCVVVLQGNLAIGIVTERDVLRYVARSNQDSVLLKVPVTNIMTFPLITVSPTYSVMSASRMMDQLHIHRLLVGSGTDIQGIVTQTDIITATQRKLEEVHMAETQREAAMADLARAVMTNLSSICDLYQRILRHRECPGELEKLPESSEKPPPHPTVLSSDYHDEAARYESILEELDSQISEAQERMAGLTRILRV